MSFTLSFYALSGIDFGKVLRKGQVPKAYALLVLLSLGLGYIVANFLLLISGIVM